MRYPQLFTASMALAAVIAGAQPASAQDMPMKDHPEIFGTYGPGGDCARFPRVIADVSGIKIVTAAGATVFPHVEVQMGFNGREDQSITVFTKGAHDGGDGLEIQFENGEFTSPGGEHMGPAEQAVAAYSSKGAMRRCGARAAVVAPPPPAPRMRATAAASVAAFANIAAMTDPGFKPAYLQALGPLKREVWLIDMDGPGDQQAVTVAGSRFLQLTTCKDRDCGDNAMLVLYRPRPRTLWGIVTVHRRATLIGNPPPRSSRSCGGSSRRPGPRADRGS